MEKKNIILIILLFTSTYFVFSQKLIRESINCMGSSVFSNDIIIKQTIGQSSSTSSFSNKGTIVRQGFQQATSKKIPERSNASQYNLTIYPNPANSFFNIKIVGEEKPDCLIIITNILGQEISRINFLELEENKISSQTWKSGIYFVSIFSDHILQETKKVIINN